MINITNDVITIESSNMITSKEILVIDLSKRRISSVKIHDMVRNDKYVKFLANYRKAYSINLFGMILEVVTEPGPGTTSTKSISHEIIYTNGYEITNDFKALLEHIQTFKK